MQVTGLECRRQTFEEQAPEQAREHANRKKESGSAGNPTLAVRRDAATRNDAVHVRVVLEVLAPGVQDCDDADVGAEVLAIGSNGDQRLGRSLKQQPVDLGLVLVGHRADHGRKREDEMKIRHRQKLSFARRQPGRRGSPLTFRAVPVAAGIIGDAGVRTVLAVLDMTTERGSAAYLNRRHDTSLGEVDVAGVGCPPGLTMAPEDFRHLEVRPDHVGLASGRRRRLNHREFKWALNLSDHVDGSPRSAEGHHFQ